MTALRIVGMLRGAQLLGKAQRKLCFNRNVRVRSSASSEVAAAPSSRKNMAPMLTPPNWTDLLRPATSETTSNMSSGIISVATMSD